jgi:hypothetical protein
MIKQGDKYIKNGRVLEVSYAEVDDNYIYIKFRNRDRLKLTLRYFLSTFISTTSLLNIDYFKRIKDLIS